MQLDNFVIARACSPYCPTSQGIHMLHLLEGTIEYPHKWAFQDIADQICLTP